MILIMKWGILAVAIAFYSIVVSFACAERVQKEHFLHSLLIAVLSFPIGCALLFPLARALGL